MNKSKAKSICRTRSLQAGSPSYILDFKKLGKKEDAAGFVSPSAEGDQRSARWMGGRFLEKATEKLSKCFALVVENIPINQNLKPGDMRFFNLFIL